MSDVVKYMYNKASERGIPLGGTFELTPLCNMNCKMCYIRMDRVEMEKIGRMRTKEEWLSIAKEAHKCGMLYLLLTGGEPFLYPEFFELYEELKKMGFVISINTNGTLLKGEILKKLIKNPPQKINITLYGGCRETYETLCGYGQGYDDVINAIECLKKAGVFVKINGSITPYNHKDVDDCIDFAKRVNVPIELGSYMFPPMRRSNKETGRFQAEEAGECQANLDRKRYSAEILKSRVQAVENCLTKGSNTRMPAAFRCRAGRSSFWINWKGEMTPCGMMELFKEYPFESGFENSWIKIKESIKKQMVMSQCIDCEKRDICRVCPAMIYSETGDFNKKPDYICKMTEKWAECILKTAK